MAGAANRKDPNSYEPWPLDIRLLEIMPDVGLIGGVHHAGRSVKGMTREINDAAQQIVVTSSQLQARCRVMREVELVETFPATGGRIWARTPKGKTFLAQHKLAQAPTPEVNATEEDDVHGS